jgi:hypothetical protein
MRTHVRAIVAKSNKNSYHGTFVAFKNGRELRCPDATLGVSRIR